jgi:hypothetical protein
MMQLRSNWQIKMYCCLNYWCYKQFQLNQGFPTFSSPRTTKWAEKFLRTTKAIIVFVAYHLKHSMLQFHI